MGNLPIERIPVVAGLAYIERVRRLPSPATVTLQAERGNRYFLQAVAVLADGEKVGYLAPEVSRRYYPAIAAHPAPVTCPARRGSYADQANSGVELILDFTSLAVQPEP